MSMVAVSGIDPMRFPRVVPEGIIMIDTFQLHAIPERLQPAHQDLMKELNLAKAPYSGRRVACILAGKDTGYGGHVIEHKDYIEDPFIMALEKVPNGAELYGIMVAGEGKEMKEKHLLPSGNGYDAIKARLIPGSPIVIVPPNLPNMCRHIPDSIHQSAYAQKPPFAFLGKSVVAIYSEAMRNTNLSVEDSLFIADLRIAGINEDIQFYLTGSGNGISGPSVAIRPGLYRDLDIIAVSEQIEEVVQAKFENVAQARYGVLDKVPKLVRAEDGRLVNGCIYSNVESGISIDFFVVKRLEDAFVRKDYFDRYWFHKVS